MASWAILPFSTRRASDFVILPTALALLASERLFIVTFLPACAKACTMPEPIVPVPITAIFSMFIVLKSFIVESRLFL